jgi:hypothetical protein
LNPQSNIAAAQADATGTPEPTATARAPIVAELGADQVDAWRIESAWICGGSMNRCMHRESEALVMARVAMGEAPDSLSDRVYVMWSIKLRAALGFKEALPGWRAPEDRWGPETSIYVEALCNGGCQYTPVRAADGIYFGCALSEHHALRAMLCPTDEQLQEFAWTLAFAEAIAEAPLTDMPEELRGYESFRSPQITWYGQRNREGGLLSRQFFPGGNIWRDEYGQDNVWWERATAQAPTPTPSPDLEPTATATATPVPAQAHEPDPEYDSLESRAPDPPANPSQRRQATMEPGVTIVVNWALVTGAIVVLGWLVNEGLALIKQRPLSTEGKKAVAFGVSVGLSGYFALQALPALPVPAVDPFGFAIGLGGVMIATFKTAQQIYDKVWNGIVVKKGFAAIKRMLKGG